MSTDASAQQGDLTLFLDDELAPSSGEEQALCQKLTKALARFEWDGLRDHYQQSIDDPLWARAEAPTRPTARGATATIFANVRSIARKEIESADVVVANHAW
ncbi:hypothetical protein J4732_07230 [Serratia marcescens]|uniref:Uncharacterized protein n=1 Tax=Serratia marcescens TaxID=615 RepID=A0A939NJP6_SERMA|nr:hypothetical protein [Serratia marcescens]